MKIFGLSLPTILTTIAIIVFLGTVSGLLFPKNKKPPFGRTGGILIWLALLILGIWVVVK